MTFLNVIEQNIENIQKRIFIPIVIIAVISFIVRFYYFPDYPVTLDSLIYFFYATDISINGMLPENYTLANPGWSIFLSVFFSLMRFEDVASYMNLQKILSIILSTLIIIPVYYFCKKFFGKKFALVGASIFAFEPRIIQNSLFGITDSLYIILVTISLVLFLGSKKMMYLSFGIAALATIVRLEGIVLLLTISIMFFIRFRNERKELPKYILAIGIFALVIAPISVYKTEIVGNELMFNRASDAIVDYVQHPDFSVGSKTPFLTGIENFSKYFAWNMIPVFVFFVPFGIYFMFKEWNSRSLMLIVGIISFSIPAFWAYSIPLQDTRYLYFLYPFLCVVSLFTISKFVKNRKSPNILLSLIVGGILVSSLIFLVYKIDNQHEQEAYEIAKIISSKAKVINSYHPESKYFEIVDAPEKWTDFVVFFQTERQNQMSILDSMPRSTLLVNSENYDNVDELIGSNLDLTHIVVDDSIKRKPYLNQIFNEEKKFPFLIKEFDSSENEFSYHVKLFKIDHKKYKET